VKHFTPPLGIQAAAGDDDDVISLFRPIEQLGLEFHPFVHEAPDSNNSPTDISLGGLLS
jgi:hypothetical protein